MAKGSYRQTKTPSFFIENRSIKLKIEADNVARSRNTTLTGFVRGLIFEAVKNATPQERNYTENDGC